MVKKEKGKGKKKGVGEREREKGGEMERRTRGEDCLLAGILICSFHSLKVNAACCSYCCVRQLLYFLLIYPSFYTCVCVCVCVCLEYHVHQLDHGNIEFNSVMYV